MFVFYKIDDVINMDIDKILERLKKLYDEGDIVLSTANYIYIIVRVLNLFLNMLTIINLQNGNQNV